MRSRTIPAALIALAALLTAVAPPGCDTSDAALAPALEPAQAAAALAGELHRAFPAHAAEVLEGSAEGAFVAGEAGFSLSRADAPAPLRALSAELPRRGDGVLRLRVGDAFEATAREVSAEGDGFFAGRAVAYRRAGGTAFWTASPNGIEEWLHLEAGAVRRGEPAAAWEIEGAELRQQGSAVLLVDALGKPWIRVTAPAAYAEGGRALEARLAIQGRRLEVFVDVDADMDAVGANAGAVLVDPAWALASSMSDVRSDHTATLLPTGKVLAAGSSGLAGSTAELYDPATDSWAPAASLQSYRYLHTATLMPDGRVLAAGGRDFAKILATAELYDATTDSWSATGSMTTTRFYHAAVLLQDGRVLAVGGWEDTAFAVSLASAEIYDPAMNAWAPVAPMSQVRASPSAIVLPNGKVLVIGGQNGSLGLQSTEIYDPTTDTWTPAATLSYQRSRCSTFLLANGKVLAASGTYDLYSELYDPQADTWTPGGYMYHGFNQAAAMLPGGEVLITGGNGVYPFNSTVRTTVRYDQATGLWLGSGLLVTARERHTATLLPTGKVLVAGGSKNDIRLATTELYTQNLPQGSSCTSAYECASAFCADGFCCDAACDSVCDACGVAAGAVADGTCSPLTGKACDDGSACTKVDACQSGVCVGGSPVVCAPETQCTLAGTCNPSSGYCYTPPRPNGTPCNDNNPCTLADSCSSGYCSSSVNVQCPAATACHPKGQCNPGTGACTAPVADDGTSCSDGNACTIGEVCISGACGAGSSVLCPAPDSCHEAGACSPATGQCVYPKKPNGAACDDGDLCTPVGFCQSGACINPGPIACPPLDQCHVEGSCDKATGLCDNPQANDGAACDDNDACTQVDSCQGGACAGEAAVVCAPLDQCHDAGACDKATGLCESPAKPNGAACDDNDACTLADACQDGACAAGSPVVCSPLDACHEAGACDAATGACSNPAKPDGAPCDGDLCVKGGSCKAGACEGSSPVVCVAVDACHEVGACDPATGACSNPAKPDGSICDDGSCVAGECVPAPEEGGASDDSGCGCEAAGAPSRSPAQWLVAALFLSLLRRSKRAAIDRR